MDIQKIGEYIKNKRKEKNLTQKELADKLFITDRAISKWERGVCCPDISLLKDLCSILDISINELLSGEDIEKFELEHSEDILVETVKQYASVEKKKRVKLWILTIGVIIIDLIFVFIMYLMYNQINGKDGLTINSIQNRYFTDRFLTLTENKDYHALNSIIKDHYFIEDECSSLKDNEYDYTCMLKELNDLGVEFVEHKNINNWFNNYDDISEYEITLEYDGKKEKLEVGLSTSRGNLREIYFSKFRISDAVTCFDLYDGLGSCYNEEEFRSYYLFQLNLDTEQFFPKDINEKIVNLFSPSNY